MKNELSELEEHLFREKYVNAMNILNNMLKTGYNKKKEKSFSCLYEDLHENKSGKTFCGKNMLRTLNEFAYFSLDILLKNDERRNFQILDEKAMNEIYDCSMESIYSNILNGDGFWFIKKNYEFAETISNVLKNHSSKGNIFNYACPEDINSAKKINENWMYTMLLHKSKNLPINQIDKINYLGTITEDDELNSWYKIDKIKGIFNKIDFGNDKRLKDNFKRHIRNIVKEEINKIYKDLLFEELIDEKNEDKRYFNKFGDERYEDKKYFNKISDELCDIITSENPDNNLFYKRMKLLRELLLAKEEQ